ncbi:MAG TPA: hypothetical protein VG496_13690 [Myxococcales bacterium]|nr:hypothetical protein [Myxococcales bacterium]
MPAPADCVAKSWECVEIALLNELDGFNVRPRLSIPFGSIDAEIDERTVNSSTVFLVSVGNALVDGTPSCQPFALEDFENEERPVPPDAGRPVGITQVVLDTDPQTHETTLYAEAGELLEQHMRYALIVTRGLHDKTGRPIEASREFRRAIEDDDDDRVPENPDLVAYKRSLRAALAVARSAGVRRHDVAAASVFTTMSVTAGLEKIRDHVNTGVVAATAGNMAVFDLAKITAMTFERELKAGAGPVGQGTAVSMLDRVLLARLDCLPTQTGCTPAVGRVAYGTFQTPNYLDGAAMTKPFATFSGTPALADRTTDSVAFNVFIPSGTPPEHGWPVVIFGHGDGDSLNGAVFNVAATFARHGFAAVGFNRPGCGFGPNSRISITADGTKTTVAAPGRAIDVNRDGTYAACEGLTPIQERRLLFARESVRQGTADVAQLIRVLKAGVNIDGNTGVLDASRVYYSGISGGAVLGTLLAPVLRDIRATAVASVGGWPSPELSPANRGAVGQFFQLRQPPLLNPPGTPVVTVLGGLPVAQPWFNENLPLPGADSEPDPAPVTTHVDGAVPIQEFLERLEWLNGPSAPGAFAPYLRLEPLAGVPARPYLLQLPRGDQNIVNPNTIDTIRGGQLERQVTVYHHELLGPAAAASFPNPHSFLIRTDNAAMKDVALLAQNQIATFFETDGAVMIDPDGACDVSTGQGCLFEVSPDTIPVGYGFIIP